MRTQSTSGTTVPGSSPATSALGPAAPVTGDATADAAPALPLPPHATFRRLRLAGFTTREAGTLVAHLVGIRGGATGWAIEEVEGLLFVRALVRSDRMGS